MIDKIDILMYLEMLFNKSASEITSEELLNVTTIAIEFSDTISPENQIGISQLLSFLPNIRSITIKNKNISKELIEKLSAIKIESLSFENCSISNNCSLDKFVDLYELRLTNCSLLSFSILSSLNRNIKNISILNPIDEKNIDMTFFSKFTELNELYLEKCVVQNLNKISQLQNLKTLSLLWSEIVDTNHISTLSNLRELKDVYVSRCYESLGEVRTLSQNKNVYYDLNHLVLENNAKGLN